MARILIRPLLPVLGARVITTAGSEEKVAKALESGADAAINYKTHNVIEIIKQFAPDGLNVWWETLREPDFDKAISVLATHGPNFRWGRFTQKIVRCSDLSF